METKYQIIWAGALVKCLREETRDVERVWVQATVTRWINFHIDFCKIENLFLILTIKDISVLISITEKAKIRKFSLYHLILPLLRDLSFTVVKGLGNPFGNSTNPVFYFTSCLFSGSSGCHGSRSTRTCSPPSCFTASSCSPSRRLSSCPSYRRLLDHHRCFKR